MALNQWGGLNVWSSEQQGGLVFQSYEVRQSRVSGSVLNAQAIQDVDIIVNEMRASRTSDSTLIVPVVITINPRNVVRVKRSTNIVRVK